MTITVINCTEDKFPLASSDLQEGHAYINMDGMLFIGNMCSTTVAYSVDGSALVFSNEGNDTLGPFKEVDIEIRIL